MAFSLGLFRVLCKMTKLGAGFLKSYLERLEIWKRTIILLDQRNRIPDDQNVCKEKTTSSASTCCRKCRIWISFLTPALDSGVEKGIQIVIFAPSLSEFRPSGMARLDAREFQVTLGTDSHEK